MLAGSRTGTPVVYTRRVAFPIRNTWLNRRRYGRCGHIMAVSRAVADECRRIAPETPVTVVHDGVRWSGASLDRDELRGRLGMKDDTFAIGSVGFFTGEKNSQLLGVLAESLLTTRPAAQLVVVGPLSAADKKRFDGLTNVTVVGPVPVATEYYSTFDMYVSTSTSEGLGSALIDAIVRDIPVVALDSGGVRDIVRDAARVAADEGDFVSAVKNAITDYDEAKREALALGTQIRDDFTIDHMVEKTRVVYEDVITRKAGAQHVGDVSTPGE